MRHETSTCRGNRLAIPAAVLLLAIPLASMAQDGPKGSGDNPREVRAKAQMALSVGAYSDAIGYLQQLVEWFGESKTEQTVTSMESVYYSLGICHVLLGQFSEARDTFTTYLKKYKTAAHAPDAQVYIADCYRFEENLGDALKQYLKALKDPNINGDLKADVYQAMARCYLALDRWDKAMPVLRLLYSVAPDGVRRNWAAAQLTTAYLKERQIEKVYQLIPYLLVPNSFASRSVTLNMAALEAGDDYFAEEKYRDALWIYRLVYPHDILSARSQQWLEYLQKKSDRMKKTVDTNPRALMRVQEGIGEVEAELKALAEIKNYDIELYFRMARSYMEIRRFREARDLFLYLHEEAKEPRAGEALFFAFQCCVRLQPWDQALEIGHLYMEKYPAGEYYDDVSIMVGQIYAKLEDWPQVITVLTKALEVSPKHSQAAECMFLIGYASFMEEKFADTVTWLRKMNTEFPDNPRESDATYWIGMALMFDRKFEEAAPEFDKLLSKWPDSPYTLDATFRRAVCEYGLSKFETAEKMLERFVARYPDHKLCGEAFMMLADISGVFGELRKAVMRYQQVPRFEINIEFYNYSYFRCAEILGELNDFKGIIAWLQPYLEDNREGANQPLAMYWIGKAMWSLEEHRGALEFFRDGIVKYGVDRKALGIDLIIEEWIGRTRGADPTLAKAAWQDMAKVMEGARTNKQACLELRLKRLFLYNPDTTEEQKKKILDDIVQESTLSNASPGVMELMLDEALKRGDTNLAIKVADATIREFTETDYALAARMFLANIAMNKGDYTTAIKHLTVIREVFATSGEAAEALMMLGNIYIKKADYAAADECFKQILGVREWRGPLWPAALYGRGECSRLQRQYEQAAAYYERIYLLYGQYRDWAGKAYLARADVLARMRQYQKAVETLQEMLTLTELKDTPLMKEAEAKIEELKRQGI